jgi:3-isopropylmalate dehydrogenase
MAGKPNRLVGLIPGDLNGMTVTKAALRLADTPALKRVLAEPLAYREFPYNADYFNQRRMRQLGDTELSDLSACGQIFLGAVGDPVKIAPGVLEVGILLKVRQAFDQYVNLRPVVLPQGILSPIRDKGPADINLEICRENSEGLYVSEGRVINRGTEDEVAEQVMRCSYKGVRRLAEYAAERALNRKERRPDRKPRLHFVFKTNILTDAAVPWERVRKEFAAQRPELDVRYMHIDNFMMQLVLNPGQFDVVLTENMFGDIATDLGAVIQGGIGSAVSGNINPLGTYPSMFEPIHGSAPDKWYLLDSSGNLLPGTFNPKGVQAIRPEAAFLSFAMMLEQMGEVEAAELMKGAAIANLKDPMYAQLTLDQLVQLACDHVEQAAPLAKK